MHIDVLTLFPALFEAPLRESILGRAIAGELLSVVVHDLRDYARDRHKVTDDAPYGGGGGMVMKPEPIFRAVDSLRGNGEVPTRVVLLSPQGRLLTHHVARELADLPHLVLVCGRYEGVDERVRTHLVDDEISIGEYVLTGGELPALVLTDAVARLIPGALGHPRAALDDSYASGLLEHPHYTRPGEYRGLTVPEVLLSGHHEEIVLWRRRQSLLRTLKRRPDLLATAELTEDDRAFLKGQGWSG